MNYEEIKERLKQIEKQFSDLEEYDKKIKKTLTNKKKCV